MTLNKINIQIVLMNRFVIIIAALLIALNTGCGNSRGKIKPNPDKENFIKCPICKGYGKIIIQTVVENKKEPDINEDSGCYQVLSCTSCLFALGWEVAHRDDKNYKERETKKEIHKIENANYDRHVEYKERPSRKKIVKCHRCNGAGWIKKYEYSITPMYDYHELESIIRANELIDQKN